MTVVVDGQVTVLVGEGDQIDATSLSAILNRRRTVSLTPGQSFFIT